MADKGDAAAPSMRIDRFLWFARLAKTRSAAQTLAAAGHLRLDGRRIDRAHVAVRPGCTLALVLAGQVRVVRIVALPARRGPAPEAQACYVELTPQTAPANENVSQQLADD